MTASTAAAAAAAACAQATAFGLDTAAVAAATAELLLILVGERPVDLNTGRAALRPVCKRLSGFSLIDVRKLTC